jgi:hypothetical protein
MSSSSSSDEDDEMSKRLRWAASGANETVAEQEQTAKDEREGNNVLKSAPLSIRKQVYGVDEANASNSSARQLHLTKRLHALLDSSLCMVHSDDIERVKRAKRRRKKRKDRTSSDSDSDGERRKRQRVDARLFRETVHFDEVVVDPLAGYRRRRCYKLDELSSSQSDDDDKQSHRDREPSPLSSSSSSSSSDDDDGDDDEESQRIFRMLAVDHRQFLNQAVV